MREASTQEPHSSFPYHCKREAKDKGRVGHSGGNGKLLPGTDHAAAPPHLALLGGQTGGRGGEGAAGVERPGGPAVLLR